MKTNFNYSAWLKNRAEKPATKVLPFSELTKVEKIATLCQLLGKSEDDFRYAKIASKEERKWHELSTPARLQVINRRTVRAQELLKEGDTEAALKLLTSPAELDLCEVEVWKTFEDSTRNSQIEFLLQKYGKPLDVVTVQLPCGQEWVNGLIEYCKILSVDPEPEAAKSAKSDKEAAKSAK